MDLFNKTACDHIAGSTPWAPTLVEIAGSAFALFALLLIGHFA